MHIRTSTAPKKQTPQSNTFVIMVYATQATARVLKLQPYRHNAQAILVLPHNK